MATGNDFRLTVLGSADLSQAAPADPAFRMGRFELSDKAPAVSDAIGPRQPGLARMRGRVEAISSSEMALPD